MSKCANLVREEMADDAIITLTREEYAKCIENFEDGALNDAARALWDIVKADVAKYFDKYNANSAIGCDALCKQLTRLTGSKLEAYKSAFEVMGYHLKYEVDWFTGKIYKVSFEIGCVIDYS